MYIAAIKLDAPTGSVKRDFGDAAILKLLSERGIANEDTGAILIRQKRQQVVPPPTRASLQLGVREGPSCDGG